jgi:hypothetical protein
MLGVCVHARRSPAFLRCLFGRGSAGDAGGRARLDCLLLVLTKGVLFRPFCIAEVYAATKAGKRIVLISEEGPRSPVRWDFDEWQNR